MTKSDYFTFFDLLLHYFGLVFHDFDLTAAYSNLLPRNFDIVSYKLINEINNRLPYHCTIMYRMLLVVKDPSIPPATALISQHWPSSYPTAISSSLDNYSAKLN